MKKDEKTQISQEEYSSLVVDIIKDIRKTAREEREVLSVGEAREQAKALVSDFYQVKGKEGK